MEKIGLLPWNPMSFIGTADEDHFVEPILRYGQFQVSGPNFGHIPLHLLWISRFLKILNHFADLS